MEVKIQVDETQFKDILENELAAFKPEELHDVIEECIGEYFRSNNYKALEKIMFDSGFYRDTPSALLKEAITKCDYSGLQDVVDVMIDKLRNDYQNILIEMLWSQISKSLAYSYSIQDSMGIAIRNAIENERNKENIGKNQ